MNEAEQEQPFLQTWQVVTLSVWNITGIIVGLLGNCLVLYGSLRYNALNMGRVTVVLIQALTISDLLLIVCKWFTDAVTTISQAWVLGSFMCFIAGQFSHALAIIEFSLISCISIFKLFILLNPIHRVITTRATRYFVGTLSLVYIVYRLTPSIFGTRSIYIHNMLTCEPNDLLEWEVFSYITNILFLAIPILSTIVANLGIMIIAWRSRTQCSRKTLPSRNAVFYGICYCMAFHIIRCVFSLLYSY